MSGGDDMERRLDAITRADLHDLRDALTDQIIASRREVVDRLDQINGRVRHNEEALSAIKAEHHVRLAHLEQQQAAKSDADAKPITRREVTVATAVLAAIVAFFRWIWPILRGGV